MQQNSIVEIDSLVTNNFLLLMLTIYLSYDIKQPKNCINNQNSKLSFNQSYHRGDLCFSIGEMFTNLNL